MRAIGMILVAAALLATPALAAPKPRPASFAMCAVCHKTAAGERSTLGPNLWGVGGRKAGALPGYAFSPAMKKAAAPWSRPRLLAFIADPRKVVPGTKMAFAGQKDPKKAAELADYLLSLK